MTSTRRKRHAANERMIRRMTRRLTAALAMIALSLCLVMTWKLFDVAQAQARPEKQLEAPCHPGQRVYANGEYVDCTNDPQSPANMPIPEGDLPWLRR